MFTVVIRPKEFDTVRCIKPAVRPSYVACLVEGNKEMVTIPTRVVEMLANSMREMMAREVPMKRRLIESIIMKHVTSNVLSYIYLMDYPILHVIDEMDRAIRQFKESQSEQVD